MKAVTIDSRKCNVCSICVQTSAGCFAKKDNIIEVLADNMTCVLCGHCVGVCPVSAITHNLMDMNNFPEVSKNQYRTTDLLQFIRERRSHRTFIQKQIPRTDLEKLVEAVRYSPTGHNEQTVELIIIENADRRKKLSNFAVDFYASAVKEAGKNIEKMKSDGKSTPLEIAEAEGMAQFLQMLIQMRDAGLDPLLYDAPAVLVFHSNAKAITGKENCVIAATTAGLLARTMGIETTFIALFASAVNSYPLLRKELGLPEENQVNCVLVAGYPKIEYLRAVDRKPVRVRWE